MQVKISRKLRFTINLARVDGTTYRTRGLTFDELASHVETQDAMLKKMRLGKYGPLPYVPNYKNPRIPTGEIVLVSIANDESRAVTNKVYAYLGKSFKSKESVLLNPGTIGLILGYKYRRFVVTYFDADVAKSSRWAKIKPTRSLRFVTVSRYARVLVDEKECLIWEGNLFHVPKEDYDKITNLQNDFSSKNQKKTK